MSAPSTSIKLTSDEFNQIKLNGFQLLKGIFNVIKDIKTASLYSIPASAIDTITAIRIEDGKGSVAWTLISRALANAVIALIAETDHRFIEEEIETYGLDEELNKLLSQKEYEIDTSFFTNPDSLPILKDVKPILEEYLKLFEFNASQIQNLLSRLERYFIFSLVNEWQREPGYKNVLENSLNTPFLAAEKREREWEHYRQFLQAQIQQPVFGESFSLEQIFVSPRAYYSVPPKKVKEADLGRDSEKLLDKIAVELDTYILSWINDRHPQDAIRIIRGGPGYGKSSFLKMIAARLAKDGGKVLFIPLHRFRLEDKLDNAVVDFLNYDKYLTFDPINEDSGPLILIFDGLDELTMQGKVLADAAQSFIREVQRSVQNYNHTSLRIQAIISGRDVVIQQHEDDFRSDGQVLRMLQYLIPFEVQEGFEEGKGLVRIDQRDIWWKQFGKLSGGGYKALPVKLDTSSLIEITSQPLLNYLVALSYVKGDVDFGPKTNLNTIYDDLLKRVHGRSYEENRKHITVAKLDSDQFSRMLEEVALTTWHGNGRTCTVNMIKDHFERARLSRLLNDLITEAEKGVFSLLASFYFRKAGFTSDGSETFEFTHKSFGEYLVAKRIMRHIRLTHKRFQENFDNPYEDDGWDLKRCLVECIQIFGPVQIDADIVRFLRNEFALVSSKSQYPHMIQHAFGQFLSHVIRHDLPMESRNSSFTSFKEQVRQARNTKIALLVVHSLAAEYTDKVTDLNLESELSFGIFYNSIKEQRVGSNVFFIKYLNALSLAGSSLENQDFFGANLARTDLSGVKLIRTCLEDANLEGANVLNAHMRSTNLRGANLNGAVLSNTSVNKN